MVILGLAADLRTGELSKLTGLSAPTILKWEREGLIRSSRSFAGHRLWGIDAIEKLREIYEEKGKAK